ncbi:hypothetical protein BJY01DRAFT_247202 [Aspergillus pseudoustus]|uniref:Heterokaryon incompatibility domain-containing protein n=1 Tax=Aspergillus pseudoustus TaxID=1810923 RepID=A0ABR4K2X6_9EURO
MERGGCWEGRRWRGTEPQEWAKKHDSPSVQVEGVDGWFIPQNTSFDVTELPNILLSACLETPYVWVDLLCIPQMPDSEHLRQMKSRVRRRSFAAPNMLQPGSTMWKTGLAYMQFSGISRINWPHSQEELPARVLKLAESDQQTELELVTLQGDEAGVINGWFSSLWNLQELCLRPDMILLDRQWRPFAIHTSSVRLDHLAALISASEGIKDRALSTLPFSDSTQALYDLLDFSGLIAIRDARRVDILSMGNQRTCMDNRAGAIMSALGVTDWYSNSTANDDGNTLSYSTGHQQQQQQYVPSDRYGSSFSLMILPSSASISLTKYRTHQCNREPVSEFYSPVWRYGPSIEQTRISSTRTVKFLSRSLSRLQTHRTAF